MQTIHNMNILFWEIHAVRNVFKWAKSLVLYLAIRITTRIYLNYKFTFENYSRDIYAPFKALIILLFEFPTIDQPVKQSRSVNNVSSRYFRWRSHSDTLSIHGTQDEPHPRCIRAKHFVSRGTENFP